MRRHLQTSGTFRLPPEGPGKIRIPLVPIVLTAMLVAACARRMPPPGKPETRGPELHLLNPQEGDTVHDTLRVLVEATDSSGVAWVRARLDRESLGADSTAPFVFTMPLSQVVDTTHSLVVEAADRWDNLSRLRITIVTRGGQPPQDSLRPNLPDTLKEEHRAPAHQEN